MVEINSLNSMQNVSRVNCGQKISQKSQTKCDLPQDTVEISRKKQPALNNIAKIVLGFTAIMLVIATAITFKSRITPKKLQKAFNEIYMRDDITIEEAQKIAKKYKELLKIENKEEFVNTAFEEVKKNFGFKDKPIKLKINTNGDSGCLIDNSQIIIAIDEKYNNLDLLSILHHEFRHAKQNEIMFNQYPKFAKEKILNVFRKEKIKEKILSVFKKEKTIALEIEDYTNSLIEKGITDANEIMKMTIEKFKIPIEKRITKYFGELSPDNVPNKYKIFAKKCMENQKNYIPKEKDEKAYRKQFVEKDAYKIQAKIYNLIDCYKG